MRLGALRGAAARASLAVLSTAASLGIAARFLAHLPVIAEIPGRARRYPLFVVESQRPFLRRSTINGAESLVPVAKENPLAETIEQDVIPERRSAGTRRILVLGESSATSLGDALGRLARELGNPSPLQIVNLGIPGASLEFADLKLSEGLRYGPDAIVCVFGHNLFTGHPVLPPPLTGIARELLRFPALERLLRYIIRPSTHTDVPQRLAALEHFISRLKREGSSRGIPVLIATLPSNDLWAPLPGLSDLEDPRYLEAIFLRHSGDRRLALRKLESALLETPSPWMHFVLGSWLYRERKYLPAYQHLTLALDEGGNRASPAVNGLIQESARKENLLFFDAAEWIKDKTPPHIPGWRDMLDNQHLIGRDFDQEARRVLAILAEDREGFPALPPAEPPSTGADFSLIYRLRGIVDHAGGFSLESYESARMTVAGLISFYLGSSAPGQVRELRANEPETIRLAVPSQNPCEGALLRLGFAQSFWEAGKRGWARSDAGKAQELCPRWAKPSIQQGLFALETGDRRGALDYFRRASKIDPSLKEARYFAVRLTP